ncbi:DNA-dependent ATPase RAD26 Ecym_1369 [Eremothecium cymbalariae DBVPG|uniref:DNA helicase n=1 Tax=Eremothecium cymbalariae (strain CBS 270.75 / DBVPG 7215 / KCTC 17166 / NRRL Y-17582) TaxID=931890 RepID=G8JND8_ERECY|nr:hypothetical protein Ecym_1369 [Eremothecium cymbalariae DBVPG\
MDGADELELWGLQGIDQSTLEQKLESTAQNLINKKSEEQERARLERYEEKLKLLQQQKVALKQNIRNATRISVRDKLSQKLSNLQEDDLAPLLKDIEDIKLRLRSIKNGKRYSKSQNLDPSAKQTNETEDEFLLRTGKITAFGNRTKFMLDVDDGRANNDAEQVIGKLEHDESIKNTDSNLLDDSEDEFRLSGGESQDKDSDIFSNTSRDIFDDGVESYYNKRLNKWIAKRSHGRPNNSYPNIPEWERPHPTLSGAKLNNDFKIPGDIFPLLFDYQKTCVQWLYELYQQKSGGIIGDEMGLGKTIQIISFLASLHHSGKLNRPVLVICPATVLKQWCTEFHKWWPPFRTIILHSIGTGMVNKKKLTEQEIEEIIMKSKAEEFSYDDYSNFERTKKEIESNYNIKSLIDKVLNLGHVLITTYVGLKIHADELLKVDWGYVVLDEGHKIRNPNSEISLTCKRLKTHHRIILSGTPIQNNLTELWSLFDFIFPGKLGTLPVFQQQFAVPINSAGYANATNIQVQTGFKCAVALRDLISPYLLRRLKVDLARDLPKKTEMVLFCKMTQVQKDKYLQFLNSDDLVKIKNGKKQVLFGIDILRKICNHPDLLEREFKKHNISYGDPKRSGKMQVVKRLLQIWHEQGHKALLFTQSRQMLDILESFISSKDPDLSHLTYLRMDGMTDIGHRHALISKFNKEPYDVFLLTTRVGGLGVNLTGANRIIIFDPDWNPSTDIQARERAWRIGQKREVSIYRLMVAGSIEEKIYHRQIFKQFLTNKILSDPNQKRFFKMNELHDLFTLGNDCSSGNEAFMQEVSKQTEKLKKDSSEGADDFNQVINIEGVSKLEGFYNAKEKEVENMNEDDRLMNSFFGGGDLTNSLGHSSMLDMHTTPTNDIIAKEAALVAQNAVNVLNKSRKLTKRYEIGIPTWTGKFGQAGIIKKKRHPQIQRSSKILENLTKPKDDIFNENKFPLDSNAELLERIRKYLQGQPLYFSKSADVVKQLQLKLKNEEDLINVRALLRGIATFDKGMSGWVLKDEFRGP